MKKGFTLVELLAVIVILAIILVIAVPQINNVIKQTKMNSLGSTAKIIAAKAEEATVENEILESNEALTCANLVKLDDNYGSCTVSVTNGVGTVTIAGANKFAGITCTGTKSNMNCATVQIAADTIIAKYNNGTNNEGLILVNNNEYRYSGSSVKNYVNFNNETWRIVGIFNGRIKLMRDAMLGTNVYWDLTDPYSNTWEGSEIEVGLNGNYLTNTGYLGSSLSDEAQNLIDNVDWYVTPITDDQNTESAYSAERPSTGAITYEGKVGLIYPSDYGYASSGCYNNNEIKLNRYNNSQCISTNWMYANMSRGMWIISPYSGGTYYALTVNFSNDSNNGVMGYSGVNIPGKGVRPSVYLKPGVKLTSTSGDGSSANNAYVFEV